MTSMRTSAAGRKSIAAHEGNKLTAYLDSVGVLTIGVGHTSAAGPPVVTTGMKITAAQSEEILTRDLQGVEADVNRLVKVPLNQSQFDALVSLVFNIGGTKFASSTLLKRLNAREYQRAADQFIVWNKGKINGKLTAIKGLTSRRQSERALFLSEGVAASSPTRPAGEKIFTDSTTIAVVQSKLYDLGYTEVGSRKADGTFDGKAGGMTRAAILIFRADNSLPPTDAIDQQLLDTLDAAPKRKLARNDAAPDVVRQTVPEVRSNWFIKIGALWAAAISAAGTFFDGILGNIGLAKGYIDPLKESFSDIPSWVWLGGVAVIAAGAYLVASHGEKKGVEAFQEGARR